LSRGGPEVVQVFDVVIAYLRSCGPLDVVPTKASINLLSRTSIGGIRILKDRLRLGILLTHRVADARIRRTQQLSPGRVVSYLELVAVADVDAKVRGWLREAHEVGMLAGRHR
jgi:hypothetical protein